MHIPIIHSRIHAKICERAGGNIVGYRFLKEWVRRMIVRKGGIPLSDIHPTILDMQKLGLIQKVSRLKFQLIKNEDSRLKKDIF